MNTEAKSKLKKIYEYGNRNNSNIIVQGDNCQVLDLLKDQYQGSVKCIYIDPPYNNGEIYTHYNDDTEHEKWIDTIALTLKKLQDFLSDDGSIWISIDDSEVHYLKVAADKVFGRNNFITTIVWQHRTTRENRKVFSNNHEYILVYARNPRKFKLSRKLLPPNEVYLSRYKNPDNDPRGPWQSVSAHVQSGHAVQSQYYEITAPNGKIHKLPNGRVWIYNKQKMEQQIAANNVWFGVEGNGVPRIKRFLNEKSIGFTPETLWLACDVGTTNMAKKHLLSLFPEKPVFDTPKPEQLIKRILEIATDEDDVVLDAYLGSGTTSAVAQKMDRRYIGIEIGTHTHDIAVSRMCKVIEGEHGGVSKDLDWSGGGGFTFHSLEQQGEKKI